MQSDAQAVSYHPPVAAAISISIAILVAVAWAASLAGVYFGLSRATAGMIVMATIPIGVVGSAAAIYALIFRGENKHLVQYGLWTNGLLAFFAFPVMVAVVVA